MSLTQLYKKILEVKNEKGKESKERKKNESSKDGIKNDDEI